MPAKRTLNLSFDLEACETWEYIVDRLASRALFVKILPAGGRRPFDAYLVAVDDEMGVAGAIKYREGTPESGPTGDPISIVAEKIHVY